VTSVTSEPDSDSDPDSDPDADPKSVARAICLRLLTAAPKSRGQLAEALHRRNVPSAAAEAVLDRLTEVGLIDDEAFAAAWVQSRHRGRGLARRALAAELGRRGVQADVADEAVHGLDPEQELRTARELVRRRLAATAGLPTATRVRRLAGLLARKGYPAGVASQIVREALEAEEPGLADVVRHETDRSEGCRTVDGRLTSN
jgi:regulatory protein